MRFLGSFVYYTWNYLWLGCQTYGYIREHHATGRHSLERLDHIVETVARCGSVAVKFVQWLTPKLELVTADESEFFRSSYAQTKPAWLRKLETLYEECPEHSLDHTLQEYERVFQTPLTDIYEPLEVIGSGSIGQVYLLREIRTQSLCVMKIVHPDIQVQIQVFQLWVWVLSFIPNVRQYLTQTIFDLHDFLHDFRTQSDFLQEANHLMAFRNAYQENALLQIPELYKVSPTILLMEYVPGTSFDDCEVPFHRKSTWFATFHMFVRSNAMFLNLNHGDLHPGNWKITKDERLVIYDFGFCWSFPEDQRHLVDLSIKTFEGTSEGSHEQDICAITDILMCIIVYQGSYDKDTLYHLLYDHVSHDPDVGQSVTGVRISPITIIKLLNGFCITRNLKVVSSCVQFLIILIQMQRNSLVFRFSSPQGHCYPPTKVYKERYVDCLNICETYHIFPEYTQYIRDTLASNHLERKTIFETVDMPEEIRTLALGFTPS